MTIQDLIDRAHRETGADTTAIRGAIGCMLGMIRRRVTAIEFQDLLVNAPGALSLLADEMCRGTVPVDTAAQAPDDAAALFARIERLGLSRGRADRLGLLFVQILHENGADRVARRVAELLFSFDVRTTGGPPAWGGVFSSTASPMSP